MKPPGCVIKNDLQLNLHGDSEFFGIYIWISTKLLKNVRLFTKDNWSLQMVACYLKALLNIPNFTNNDIFILF